ncbi:hypothetical protein L917_21549 [Phytophthora nicotianae]|uniref:Uncharacterized protein n=1 Tax=Phytophthora nicotianae TaxID=4792 RepID=W2JXB1_PHYNI|nr:hypothetical protein L917_21549 [Phytophthora nicotianae]
MDAVSEARREGDAKVQTISEIILEKLKNSHSTEVELIAAMKKLLLDPENIDMEALDSTMIILTSKPKLSVIAELLMQLKSLIKGGDNKEMIAEMMKLVGNSAFGRSGMDKSKHKEFCYEPDSAKVRAIVEKQNFHSVEELAGSYEVSLKKRRIKFNNPIHLSIAIYQLAKLRMLQFYYDCIDYYFDRSDFQYQEMDTDSAYIAFSCDNPFEECIKPALRNHFTQHKYAWFPSDRSKEDAAFDRRTPGLFKEEFRCNAMVSLSSKNYI